MAKLKAGGWSASLSACGRDWSQGRARAVRRDSAKAVTVTEKLAANQSTFPIENVKLRRIITPVCQASPVRFGSEILGAITMP